jgi:F420-dependent oxidoreductase-like protein
MLEAYTTLGYLAARTTKAELVAWVTAAVYRQPGMLAKIVTTLDVLSEGRAWLGIGAAWNEAESRGLGLDFPPTAERFERLEETLQICLQMWSADDGAYDGRHYQLARTLNSPQARQKPHPPILIGGGGEKVLLKLVAKHADIWNNLAVNLEQLEHKAAVLRRHCEAQRRDPATLRISQQTMVVIGSDEADARSKSEKAARIYGGHMGSGISGTPAQCVDKIHALQKHGCSLVIIEFFGRDSREPAALFAEQVMPAFA